MIAVRPARAEEAAALSELCFRSKASWGYDAAFMQRSRAALTVKPTAIAAGRVIVAAEGEALLGVVAVEVDGDTADLDLLFVEPAAFGRQVGRKLLDAAAALARQRGARRMTILADPGARPFYEKAGARFIRMAPSDAIPGRELPLLELAL
ncbi:GNAT family N-acetyltransferase [Desertibaculum subflavum]|uniref:GNAT family N-acetyltransferase n=1 Tax=Desertibaculum subflavum TaxID=2268458 RepID=UPI000E667FB8